MESEKYDIWKNSLLAFRQQIASTSPTPGGGSVSVVSATFGLSLAIMAMEITAQKSDFPSLSQEIVEARKILDDLAEYANQDIQVFENYMTALRLSKRTEEEIQFRKTELAKAVIAATQSPIDAGNEIIAAMKLCLRVVNQIKKGVISDVGAGGHLMYGAIEALMLNVDINISTIKDKTAASEFERQKASIQQLGYQLNCSIAKHVKDILAE